MMLQTDKSVHQRDVYSPISDYISPYVPSNNNTVYIGHSDILGSFHVQKSLTVSKYLATVKIWAGSEAVTVGKEIFICDSTQ